MWIYAYNDAVIAPPDIHTTYPGLPPMPEDFPDETLLAALADAFPGKDGDELLRLEDHIRHEPVTFLCECSNSAGADILRKFRSLPANLRIEPGKTCRRPDPDLLPPLYGGQWRVCEGCPHFTLQGSVGRCNNRWHCKWGASRPREWNVESEPVRYHSQCSRIVRHFRFEAAFLFYLEKFEDEAAAKDRSGRFRAEREHLLRRDIAAAAGVGNLPRVRKRCAELGETFAEFAARSDIVSRMLSFWEVNRRLLDNLRLLREEGVPIPQKLRDELLRLPCEDGLREELCLLLFSPPPAPDRNI
ncbi:MAG: hypothetical protein IJS14_02115 [Lentisphaeria bacterium]|nr:hypothetical protein [Lentisphaeria bacterium]